MHHPGEFTPPPAMTSGEGAIGRSAEVKADEVWFMPVARPSRQGLQATTLASAVKPPQSGSLISSGSYNLGPSPWTIAARPLPRKVLYPSHVVALASKALSQLAALSAAAQVEPQPYAPMR